MEEKLSWRKRLGHCWERNWWVTLLLLACFVFGIVFGYYWSLPYLNR